MEVIVFIDDSSDRKGGEASRELLGQYTQFINRYNILSISGLWGDEIFYLTRLQQTLNSYVAFFFEDSNFYAKMRAPDLAGWIQAAFSSVFYCICNSDFHIEFLTDL